MNEQNQCTCTTEETCDWCQHLKDLADATKESWIERLLWRESNQI